ncbi:MAG: electron transfer flavoprotein subunit beta/FixA family protein [Candidatus Dormibacteraeota bacterium]|uniref:Electron transfer flavoprotein subunit beta n=1 Tax=Candidatus Aeolococcus gillhamiae TaxID=3127015 RepID=A0A2W5ZM25_9BACT|nr:electron transfer flavoprotein subunit beta/FixA family protein [Candidatus Dormibacteraeota bacterium]PZR83886.1 MAG: electron transfer flavoprotein subunit alpha [Candidatus Dormibacter sp. RRmetagenome_bin12]
MNVVVCVKQVPDPNSPGQLDPGTHTLKRDGELVLDPGDEFGVEAGLQLAEKHGGEVTVVSMGPDRGVDAVRKALAMGAAKGVLITDDALAGSDAMTTAKVLAAAIRKQEFDVVITATESTDGYTGVVPQMLAGLLDIPAVTFAKSVVYEGDTLRVERQTETGIEVVEAKLPVVISVTAGVNEPRYPSLKGIMGAKQKPLDRPTVADLGLDGLGGASAGQKVTNVSAAAQRAAGEIIQDDGEAAKRIVDFLAERKVI